MINARYSHASCTLKDRHYVFGGYSDKNDLLQVVETRDLIFANAPWQSVGTQGLTQRALAGACDADDESIIIMGGVDSRGSLLRDVILFVPNTRHFERVLNLDEGFKCESQTVAGEPGQVLSFVTCANTSSDT